MTTQKPRLTQKRLQAMWIGMQQFSEESINSDQYTDDVEVLTEYVNALRDWWEEKNDKDLFAA